MRLAVPSIYAAAGLNGWKGDQLPNACAIIDAAQQLDLGRDAQIIMAAMGEGGLKNITCGDRETGGHTNPDGSPTSSIGPIPAAGQVGGASEIE